MPPPGMLRNAKVIRQGMFSIQFYNKLSNHTCRVYLVTDHMTKLYCPLFTLLIHLLLLHLLLLPLLLSLFILHYFFSNYYLSPFSSKGGGSIEKGTIVTAILTNQLFAPAAKSCYHSSAATLDSETGIGASSD